MFFISLLSQSGDNISLVEVVCHGEVCQFWALGKLDGPRAMTRVRLCKALSVAPQPLLAIGHVSLSTIVWPRGTGYDTGASGDDLCVDDTGRLESLVTGDMLESDCSAW